MKNHRTVNRKAATNIRIRGGACRRGECRRAPAALACLTALALVPAALGGWLGAQTAPAPVGRAVRVIPRADVTRAARTLRLNENDPLAEQDRVRTGAGGRARLSLVDGSIINVGQSSEFIVRAAQEASRASALELRYGRLRAWVAGRTGGGSFQIRTNTAVCGVLGTTIFVEATRDLTRVANVSEEETALVRVTSTDARVTHEVLLRPGEGTAVPSRRPPQPPRRWTREEMQAAYDDTDVQ